MRQLEMRNGPKWETRRETSFFNEKTRKTEKKKTGKQGEKTLKNRKLQEIQK